MSFIVAIDGPAGAGKGTITQILSKKLNLVNIDTGATYRCVALQALREKVSLEEENKLIEIAGRIKIEMDEEQRVFLNGEDVTKQIREKEVSKIVSPVSSIKEVRYKMVELQRKMAEGKNVIMEGRDITTYVFPNADIKIYLDASEEERIKRRYEEMKEKGIPMTYEEVIENIKSRDYNDMHKEMGALKIAEDAIVVDSTGKTIDEVANEIEGIIRNKLQTL